MVRTRIRAAAGLVGLLGAGCSGVEAPASIPQINAGTSAEVSVLVSATPAVARPGDTVQFVITLLNEGPATAQSLAIVDTLPAGLALTGITSGAGQIVTDSLRSVSWTLPDLNATADVDLLVTALVDSSASGILINRVRIVNVTSADLFFGNNVDSAQIRIDADAGQSPDLLFQDDFETGDLGTTSPEFRWGAGNGESGALPRVSNDIARSGAFSLKFTFTGNADLGDDAWSEQRFFFADSLSEVYLQWYQYFPTGSDGLGPRFAHRDATGPDNNKFLRLWDIDYSNPAVKTGFSFLPSGGGGDARLITEYATALLPMGNYGSGQTGTILTDVARGRWVRFQVHVKLASSLNNDGVIELWIDGQQVINNQTLNLFPVQSAGLGNFIKNGYLMGWANSGFTTTTFTYIDDFAASLRPIPDF